MKIAIVHDWFTDRGGAENVVEELLTLFPEAQLFSLVDFFNSEQRQSILKGKKVTTTFIQNLPFASKIFRHYLFFFPLAIERLDLRDFDLIISSSYAVAKGVISGPDQIHISYCHSPMRYAWDMYFDYLQQHNVRGFKEKFLSYVLHKIRIWDVVSSNRVDYFIANSSFVQKRITKYYRRDSKVIHPPVDVSAFSLCTNKEDFYFTASRLVPYKKIKMIAEAFAVNGKKLIIAGSGPEFNEIKKNATPNITLLGYISNDAMIDHMQRAKAFVFSAHEDFGIVPVEAMACGTPIIAYGRGGVLDTVINGVTGTFFHEQNIDALNEAIKRFETMSFNYDAIAKHAQKSSAERFKSEMNEFIKKTIQEHNQ